MRGLMFMKGILQPKTSTPMAPKKLYNRVLELGTNSSTSASMTSSLSRDLLACYGEQMNKLSTNEKETSFQQIAQELHLLYGILLQFVNGVKVARHNKKLIIYM